VKADFKMALEYTGNVDGSLLSIDQHIPSEILLDFDSSFQLNFVARKGLISLAREFLHIYVREQIIIREYAKK